MTRQGGTDSKALAEVAYALAAAERIVAAGRTAYLHDERSRLASEAVISRLGEAAGRLSETFLDAHPDIPWGLIRGMRNKIAHEYSIISYGRVWDTMVEDLSGLQAALEHQLPPPADPAVPDR